MSFRRIAFLIWLTVVAAAGATIAIDYSCEKCRAYEYVSDLRHPRAGSSHTHEPQERLHHVGHDGDDRGFRIYRRTVLPVANRE
jgi:hypothetical protein